MTKAIPDQARTVVKTQRFVLNVVYDNDDGEHNILDLRGACLLRRYKMKYKNQKQDEVY